MRDALRYIAAALCLGLIAVWGSENLFWSAPPDDLTAAAWLLTWGAYALASACALSAVAWTGIGGWRGVFLGGALLGFLVEGVIVGTMYDAFPFQLVWTPLAWHALLTALLLGGVARMAGVWSWPRLVAAQVGCGAFAGIFALFWPQERPVLPDGGLIIAYIAGVGLVLPLAHAALDRLGTVPRPRGWVMGVVPGIALLVWGAQTVAVPNPLRLCGPVMIGATLWVMRRLGQGEVVSLGVPAGFWRRMSVMLVPLAMLAVALPGWNYLGPVPGNVVVAVVTVPVSAGLWLWLLWQAMRAAP
jgi:hypothetical protein